MSVSTQTLKPNFVVNVHEIGGVFYNPPTPDKVGPLQTSLLLTVPKKGVILLRKLADNKI